jgi:hypothetical protein
MASRTLAENSRVCFRQFCEIRESFTVKSIVGSTLPMRGAGLAAGDDTLPEDLRLSPSAEKVALGHFSAVSLFLGFTPLDHHRWRKNQAHNSKGQRVDVANIEHRVATDSPQKVAMVAAIIGSQRQGYCKDRNGQSKEGRKTLPAASTALLERGQNSST